jgi:hypothetical protein
VKIWIGYKRGRSMQHRLLMRFIWIFVLSWIIVLQPDGFAERTLVRGLHGLKPIEQFVAGNCVVVVADGGQLQPHSINRTMSYVAHHFIKIQIKDVCVCAAPHQKFYSCTRNDWVSACELQVSEQLLCGNGKVVCVDAVETVHKQQKMHTFSVETSHIFCVTPYEIIAHNSESMMNIAGAATTALTFACPPAGIAARIGQAIVFGVVTCVMFCVRRKCRDNATKHAGCFPPRMNFNDAQKNKNKTGCHHPVPDCPVVCDIQAGQRLVEAANKPTSYEKPEAIDANCKFPVAKQGASSLHDTATATQQSDVDKAKHSASQNDSDKEKRYDGPKYHRTEDWIKEHPFGQQIKNDLIRSGYVNQGKRAFEVLKNIDECTSFKKGDYVVIDALHKDHLEVFDKSTKWKQVANLDGTLNVEKTNRGKKESRRQLERG